jgi:hypothetical protein
MLPSIVSSIEGSTLAMVAAEQSEKVRENRLRRMAERQRLALEKSRRRDPRAYDYGLYRIVDLYRNTVVAGGGEFSMSLDDVERYLTGGGGDA